MNGYHNCPERFPLQVREVMLRAGTLVHSDYEIIEPLYLSGTELCYHARQISSGIDCLLMELLPLRWCSADVFGRFEPYHEDMADVWSEFRRSALARLAALQQFADEASVPGIKDGFEERGTVWYVTRYRNAPALADTKQLIAPKNAINMLAPLLDTLSGMHEEGLCHGAISAGAIHLHENEPELRDWLNFSSLASPEPIDDVKAVSLVLWQMMTGEADYSDEAGEKLPSSVRTALYNGLFDETMTIGKLWKQLHAKKPAKRFQQIIMHPQQRSVLAKIFSPVVTVAFCACCIASPFLVWRMETGALVNETAAQTLDDVAYSLASDEVQVPELLYLDADEATRTLEELGLEVLLTPREDNPVIPENQVLTQSPTAGAVLKTGETVTLTISDGWANFVPDVCGLPKEQAKEKLEELGFVVTIAEKISPDDAPGTVIAQSTRPDTKLERDSKIKLTVSLGREDLDVTQMEKVDDYVGTDFETAKAELTSLHLYAVQVDTVYDPEIPAGIIISQDIEPGKTVPQGTAINMVVSKGVETTQVPSVLHLNADNARQLLTAAKLQCVVCYVSNSEWAMDAVLSQNIAEGERVPVGTEVWLEVSVGSGSWVASTGGWSGAPLPTFESDEESSEGEEDEPAEDETDTETEYDAPAPTDAPETEAYSTEAPYVSETETNESAPVSSEEEMTAPPMPLE